MWSVNKLTLARGCVLDSSIILFGGILLTFLVRARGDWVCF